MRARLASYPRGGGTETHIILSGGEDGPLGAATGAEPFVAALTRPEAMRLRDQLDALLAISWRKHAA